MPVHARTAIHWTRHVARARAVLLLRLGVLVVVRLEFGAAFIEGERVTERADRGIRRREWKPVGYHTNGVDGVPARVQYTSARGTYAWRSIVGAAAVRLV